MFTSSLLVEVSLPELSAADLAFLEAKNRAKGSAGYLMDGTNYTEQYDAAVEAGCSEPFLSAYRQAIFQQVADLVLFCI